MPHAQFEARERVRQARRKRGVDSDKSTVQDKDEEDGEDKDDPQEEAAPIEARIRETTVNMFKRVLFLSQGAAEALYNDQMIQPWTYSKTSLMTSSRSSDVPSGSQEGMDLDTKSLSFP
jgi:hypothetical protein